MKYCPQCKRQFDEPWLSFCSDDGTPLIQELTPPRDPNWNPSIREPRRETKVDDRSEQETQWFPRQPPMPGGWIAADESAGAGVAAAATTSISTQRHGKKPGAGAGVDDYSDCRIRVWVLVFWSAARNCGGHHGRYGTVANQEDAR